MTTKNKKKYIKIHASSLVIQNYLNFAFDCTFLGDPVEGGKPKFSNIILFFQFVSIFIISRWISQKNFPIERFQNKPDFLTILIFKNSFNM